MVGRILGRLMGRSGRSEAVAGAHAESEAPVAAGGVSPTVRTSRLWPVAAVLVAGMVLAPIGYGIYKITTAAEAVLAAPGRLLGGMGDTLAEAMRPKITVNNVVMSAITSMQAKSKLVVLDTAIDLDVTRDDSFTTLGVVYLGTNRVRLVARDNHVQHVIDLAGMGPSDFVFDEAQKVLTLTVPRPRLDEEMVSVQSDPAKCYPMQYDGGWMRFDKSDTLSQVRAMLRPSLLEQARSSFVEEEAQRAGLTAIRGFVTPLLAAVEGEGVTIEVKYRDASPAVAAK